MNRYRKALFELGVFLLLNGEQDSKENPSSNWLLFGPEPGRFPTCGHCLSWDFEASHTWLFSVVALDRLQAKETYGREMVLDERTPTKTKRQDGSGCNFCILLPKHENASKYKYPTGAKEQIQMETLCKCFISFSTSGSSMLSYVIPCPIIATLPCVPWQPFSKVCGLASVDLGELLPSWISWTDVGKSHLFLGGSNSHRTIGSMYSIFTRTILYFPNIQLLEFYDKSRSI